MYFVLLFSRCLKIFCNFCCKSWIYISQSPSPSPSLGFLGFHLQPQRRLQGREQKWRISRLRQEKVRSSPGSTPSISTSTCTDGNSFLFSLRFAGLVLVKSTHEDVSTQVHFLGSFIWLVMFLVVNLPVGCFISLIFFLL